MKGGMHLLVVYASKTGNVRRFIKKLDIEAVEIYDSLVVSEPFVLVTYTTGFGNIPKEVEQFLEHNHRYLHGVAASGNRNWGQNFCASADKISARYKLANGDQIPILHKFELFGTQKDIDIFSERVRQIGDETH